MKWKLILLVLALFAISGCGKSGTVTTAARKSEPILAEMTAEAAAKNPAMRRRLDIIQEAIHRVGGRKTPPVQTKPVNRITVESVLADLQGRRNTGTRPEEENIETVELALSGSARISTILKPAEFDEDETKLQAFLKDAYCLNLNAIDKNEPPPSDDDYKQLILNHVIQLPSSPELSLINKARTFEALVQNLYEGNVRDPAFSGAVTIYCKLL